MKVPYITLLAAASSNTTAYTISSFLDAAQKTLGYWGSIFTSIVGVVMVIVGIYQFAKNLISHGKGQNSWVVTFLLILVGGALAIAGGWAMIGNFARGSKATLSSMAQGNPESGGSVTDPF